MYHFQENMQFLRVARGSLFEAIDYKSVAVEEGYIDVQKKQEIEAELYEVIKILNGYIQYLQKQKAIKGKTD